MAGLSRRRVEISNQFGLHLRVASRLVQLAQQFHSEVRVLWDGRVADGKSILDLMTLGASRVPCSSSRSAGQTRRRLSWLSLNLSKTPSTTTRKRREQAPEAYATQGGPPMIEILEQGPEK